jgi:hypothetical protein
MLKQEEREREERERGERERRERKDCCGKKSGDR